MGIGAIGFSPYIFNTNSLSSTSMNRVKPVDSDVTKASTDYLALTDASSNMNPLKRGESANFVDILESQMAMSRMNAARVMVPSDDELIG